MEARNDTVLPRVLYFVSMTGAKGLSTRIRGAKKKIQHFTDANVCHFKI